MSVPARGFRLAAEPARIRGWYDYRGERQRIPVPLEPDTWVDARVAADGTVSGGAEGITLVGRQTGPKIEGDVTNGACGLHFTVTRHS